MQNQSKIKVSGVWLRELEKNLKSQLSKSSVRQCRRLKEEMNLVFLDTAAAKRLNNDYRHKNYATDVLSFPMTGEMGLGDLVICLPVIKKQAKEHDLKFEEELAYVILHGVLHLLGYDHELSVREDRIMMRLQDRVFERLIPSNSLDT